MRAEVIVTAARLDDIGPAWELLWQRCGGTLFQSHGWVRAWWSGQNPGARRLRIAVCWNGDDLAAVIPCATRLHRGIRTLEWAAKDCSDYCDAIVNKENPSALPAAWQAMIAAGGFDAVYLNHLPPGAALAAMLDHPQAGLRRGRRQDVALQVRRNGLTGAEWFRTLTKKARNNHMRGKRILEELGPLTIGTVDGPAAEATLERMILLKRDWLAATGQRNPLLDGDARGLRRLIACLRQRGALQIFAVTCAGEFVAGLVNIVRPGAGAAFFAAFDPRFDRASPGTIVIVEYLRSAFDDGWPEVDFLCGDEPYKAKFANAQTDLASYVGARTVVGHAALAAAEWADSARRRRQAAAALERGGKRPAATVGDTRLAVKLVGLPPGLGEPRRSALRAALSNPDLLAAGCGRHGRSTAAHAIEAVRQAVRLPGAVAGHGLGWAGAACALYRSVFRQTVFIAFLSEPPDRLNWLGHRVLRAADRVLVDGDAAARAASHAGFPGGPLLRIRPRYALDPFLCAAPRPPAAQRRIVVAGDLGPGSGAADFLGAVMAWAETHPRQSVALCWIGEGDLASVLAAQPLPANVSQDFLGRLESHALAATFAQSGILVAPSLAHGQPTLVAEGLAAGLPVAGSRRNRDVRHFVTDGINGWLFESLAPKDLLQGLTRVLATPAGRLEEMRASARAAVLVQPTSGLVAAPVRASPARRAVVDPVA